MEPRGAGASRHRSLGALPGGAPSQGRAQPLLEARLAGAGVVSTVHFTFTLTAEVTLCFTHSLLVSGFMSLSDLHHFLI